MSSRSPGLREEARPRRVWREIRGADQWRDDEAGDEDDERADEGVSENLEVEGSDFRSL